jgi:hypothetical protein
VKSQSPETPVINFPADHSVWSTTPKFGLHRVLVYIRAACLASKCQDHRHSIMANLPNGTYNIINNGSGRYANLAQATAAQYTPVIAWNVTGTGSQNSQVTSALLHFVGLIFDLLSQVGVGVRGRQFLHYPEQSGPEYIC